MRENCAGSGCEVWMGEKVKMRKEYVCILADSEYSLSSKLPIQSQSVDTRDSRSCLSSGAGVSPSLFLNLLFTSHTPCGCHSQGSASCGGGTATRGSSANPCSGHVDVEKYSRAHRLLLVIFLRLLLIKEFGDDYGIVRAHATSATSKCGTSDLGQRRG